MKHDEAFEALVLANPIEDAEAFVDQMAAPMPFLTTTMERIQKMDTLESKTEPTTKKNRWSWAIVTIGAATVVIAAVLIATALSGSDDEELLSVASDSPDYVTIEVTPQEFATGGTFTATGSAVCDSGHTRTMDWAADETQWWYETLFTCADFSGTFILRSELPPLPSEPATLDGTWRKIVGDGDYASAVASGTMTATPPGLTVSLPGPVGFVPETGTVTYVGEMNLGEDVLRGSDG